MVAPREHTSRIGDSILASRMCVADKYGKQQGQCILKQGYDEAGPSIVHRIVLPRARSDGCGRLQCGVVRPALPTAEAAGRPAL